MTDQGFGGFLALIFPDFGAILAGGVEAVTPLLVLLIWLVAAGTIGYALRQARTASKDTDEINRLVDKLVLGGVAVLRSGSVIPRFRSEVAEDAWREFDETLVAEGGKVFSTVSAEVLFNEHRFAPGLVGNRILHAVPTGLTTLGLLGTFVGLTVGLRDLDLGSSTGELRGGIQTLVDGAALGFTASLWGVFTSLLTNFIERWLEGGVVRRIRQLQARIDKIFVLRSPEQSLSEIASSSSESREALQVLHEKIGTALQEAVRDVSADTSRAVGEAIGSSLAPIMRDLAERAANQSADVFKEVAGQLTSSFHEIGASLAGELRASSDAMRGTLDDLGDRLTAQAEQHLSQMDAQQQAAARQLEELSSTTTQQLTDLTAATTSQLRAVTDATSRQMELLDTSLPAVVTGLQQAAGLIGSATAGMEGVTTGLARSTTALAETSTRLGALLADAISTMDDLADRTAAAADVITSQQATTVELAVQSAAVAERLSLASDLLRDGFDGMSSHQAAFLSGLEKRLRVHSADMAGWLAEYADKVSEHTDHRMGEWNKQTERFASTMLTASQALSHAIDEMSAEPMPPLQGEAA